MSKLKAGLAAPTFQSEDIYGNPVVVPTNNKWNLLSFHRFAACPFCLMRTNELAKAYPKFQENNIEVISIWPSKKELLLKYSGDSGVPFPLVSDPEKKIYMDYGVHQSSPLAALRLLFEPLLLLNIMKHMRLNMKVDRDPMMLPADFLIGPDGKVAMAYYGKHYGDHVAISKIFNRVKRV